MSNKSFSFKRLDWDSTFFKTECGKLILNQNVSEEEWTIIFELIYEYNFIVIQNEDSNYINSKFIGEKSRAYLIDINIQFQKKVDKKVSSGSIKYMSGHDQLDRLLTLSNFSYSRFFEDKKLSKLGGQKVYKEWVKNATLNNDKTFVYNTNEKGLINGYALVSEKTESITIELIAVDKDDKEKGIGTKLFESVERYACKKDIPIIEVGTQVNNTTAINFYHRMGCKQVSTHQIFHLWNK